MCNYLVGGYAPLIMEYNVIALFCALDQLARIIENIRNLNLEI